MGISGIRSKQLRAPYGVSRARWVNKIRDVSSVSCMLLICLNIRFLRFFYCYCQDDSESSEKFITMPVLKEMLEIHERAYHMTRQLMKDDIKSLKQSVNEMKKKSSSHTERY